MGVTAMLARDRGPATTVTILKNIAGDAGQRSGSVQVGRILTNFQLGVDATKPFGDLIGGAGDNSGTRIDSHQQSS